MNAFADLSTAPWVQRLGWVLIHFIWQGTCIALLLALILPICRHVSSHFRYVVIGSALAVCGVMPLATWGFIGFPAESPQSATIALNPALGEEGETAAMIRLHSIDATAGTFFGSRGIEWKDRLDRSTTSALPYMVYLWFGGVAVLTLRLALGWAFMRRILRSGLPVRESPRMEEFHRLWKRMQVGVPVVLLQSALIEVPTLIGWLRPTILIPTSVFMGLTPEQLESILAHELAHVRRYDYLINLLQTLLETLLFYHPAVWWISHKLREERENCCDDAALEVTRDRLIYITALAKLEEKRELSFTLAATGGSLLQRIKRMVGVNDRKTSMWPLAFLIMGVIAVTCLMESKMKADQSGSSKTVSPVHVIDLQSQMIEVVRKGDAKALQTLIDRGADPKAIKSTERPTLLFYAGGPEVAEILIRYGVDPKVSNGIGETALDIVCGSEKKNAAATARVLLQHGADPNSREGELGLTPLMNARSGDLVDVLIEYGADLKARDNGGKNLDSQGILFSSVFWRDDISRFKALLRHGASFNPQTDGPTLLMYCVQNTNLLLAKWLLEHGVDPNLKGTWDKRSNFQSTPLHTAVADGGRLVQLPGHDDEEATVKLLLAHGAKVTDEMVFALKNNRPILVKLFWDSGRRDISELSYRISQGTTASEVQNLLDRGMPADPPQDRHVTPLTVAAGLGRMDLVQLLVEHEADVNKGDPLNLQYPQYRPTPLSTAATVGQEGIVEYLLRHGATPAPEALLYAATNSFSVPIPGWRSQDHFERCVKLLIDAGALKSATPEEGGQILSAAMLTGGEGGNPTVLKMLLDAGLSPELPMQSQSEGGKVSVLSYYQDFYIKKQNYYRFIDRLKVLLGLLEKADGSSAPK